jgi:hypothetical protein
MLYDWQVGTMNKTILAFMFICLAATMLSAQSQAVIRQMTGKVELQAAPQQVWVPAKTGMTIPLGASISTGFNSMAVLELGSSVVQVNPLTRMRIDELVQKQGTVRTDLFLRVGKVKADIKSVQGLAQDFRVKSPVSTAAVRGTGFEYDGYDLYVYEGKVTFSNLIGQSVTYAPGEQGGTTGYDTPAEGAAGQESLTVVTPYAPGLGGESSGGVPVTPNAVQTGGVIIVITEPPAA